MSVSNYAYNTAAHMAREIGFHRTTVVEWIKIGNIGSFKKMGSPNCNHKIPHYEFKPGRIQQLKNKKPYKKHNKTWSDSEIYVLKTNWNLPDNVIADMIKRNERAVLSMRYRVSGSDAFIGENKKEPIVATASRGQNDKQRKEGLAWAIPCKRT